MEIQTTVLISMTLVSYFCPVTSFSIPLSIVEEPTGQYDTYLDVESLMRICDLGFIVDQPRKKSNSDVNIDQPRKTSSPEVNDEQLRKKSYPDVDVQQPRKTSNPDVNVLQPRKTSNPDVNNIPAIAYGYVTDKIQYSCAYFVPNRRDRHGPRYLLMRCSKGEGADAKFYSCDYEGFPASCEWYNKPGNAKIYFSYDICTAARKTLRLLFHSVELAAVFALKTFTVSIGERQMTHVAMAFFPLYWPNWRSSMPTGPLTSILVATFGLREVTTIGAILAATALFLCTFSANVSQMILCFGLFAGFGFGLLYLPALVTVGQYFTTKRALATGITLSGSGVGAFVFAPLAKFLIDKYGWRGAMWIFSGIALNRVPLGLLLRPLPSSEKPLMQQVFRRMSTVIMGPDGLPKAPIRHRQCSIKKVFNFELFKSVTFICFGSTCFLCMFGFFIPFLYIPDMVIEMGMTSTQAAALISIVGAFSTCGRIGAGWIVDKHWTDCILFTSCTLMISGAATIFVPYYSIFWIMAAYSAVFGLSIAVFVSLRSIILAELLGIEKLSSALGLVTLCQGSATLIGAPVAGALADISGSYDISLVMSGSAFICAGLLCLPLRKIRNWEYMPTDESGTELSKLAFSLSKGMRKVAFGMDFAYWGDEYEREREMHLRRMSIKSRKSSTKSRKSKKSTSSRMSTKSRSSKKSKTSITEVSVIPVPEICQDDFRKDSRL